MVGFFLISNIWVWAWTWVCLIYQFCTSVCAAQCEWVSITVPGLRLSKVQVVDAIQIHVLSMPRKRTLPHPKIQVRRVNSFDFNPALVLHYVQNSVEMANVPLSHILQRRDSAVVSHTGKLMQLKSPTLLLFFLQTKGFPNFFMAWPCEYH